MRDAIAVTADVVTIVGILVVLAFLLNHPTTKRFGVWAGALRNPHGYGWKRRQRGWRRWRRSALDRLLSPLSRLGSEMRQPMKPTETAVYSYEMFREEMMQRLAEQRARDQYLMGEAGARIATRRWQRGHRRLRCEICGERFRDTLLLCMDDCSWNEQHPKHLRHRCNDCLQQKLDAATHHPTNETADPSQPATNPAEEPLPAGEDDRSGE